MLVSESWLREWVNPSVDTDTLAAQFTMAGLEVDSVEPVAAEFSGIVVAEIISAEPHPDADKLQVCQVNAGGDEPLQIVCGASNARAGLKAPLATVGGKIGKDFKIKKAKLRGVASFGMLCSEQELGLAEESDGLLELPVDAPVGTDIREYLNLDDQIIEVDLTPNRGDCLSMIGVSREIGVLNQTDRTPLQVEPVAASNDKQLAIELNAKEACPKYVGRVITGVNAKAETPLWMKEKLRRAGLRSISFLVDVTNFVLIELGQPMHAFDLDKINGGINVRMAKQDESLTLLDGQEVKLRDDTLVIADDSGALAMAGIMGGEPSSVTDDTQNILLEAAHFAPIAIAGKARSYGLHTDSSHRFERGVDAEMPNMAMERATQLVLEVAGGEAGPVVEAVDAANMPVRETILLRKARIAKILGTQIDDATVSDILVRLGMQVGEVAEGWQVTAPSFRFDIAIEVDLIEEVGRLYGYNNLPTARSNASLQIQAQPENKFSISKLRQALVNRGYQEAVTYSFVDKEIEAIVNPGNEPIPLANPLSAEIAVMRTSIWSGLLRTAQMNLNRQQNRIRLFETGLNFTGSLETSIEQKRCIAGLCTGSVAPEQWTGDAAKVDFFDAKSDVEALLNAAGTSADITYVPGEHPLLHPGQTAKLMRGEEQVGWLGALHPQALRELGIDQNVFVFELELAGIDGGQIPKFLPISKFPTNRRDLAIIVDEALEAASVISALKSVDETLIKDVNIFDVYRGKGIEQGKKSFAISMLIQSADKTLTDVEIEELIAKAINVLSEKFKAVLRG